MTGRSTVRSELHRVTHPTIHRRRGGASFDSTKAQSVGHPRTDHNRALLYLSPGTPRTGPKPQS